MRVLSQTGLSFLKSTKLLERFNNPQSNRILKFLSWKLYSIIAMFSAHYLLSQFAELWAIWGSGNIVFYATFLCCRSRVYVCGCVSSRKYKPDPTRESVVVGEVGDIAPSWFDLNPELEALVMLQRSLSGRYSLWCLVVLVVWRCHSHSPSLELWAQNYDAVSL